MIKFILDLLFPISCLNCGQGQDYLCPACLQKIPLFKNNYSKNLIITTSYQDKLVQKIIQTYKYRMVKDLAEPLSELMIQQLSKLPIKPVVLIPIPLHRKRLRWRGFNQSELLAEKISQKLKLPIYNDLLVRQKDTLPQAKIKEAKIRKENIKNSFQLNYELNLKDKNIILIDDVLTTGATLDEASLVLRKLEPKSIWRLVLAKG